VPRARGDSERVSEDDERVSEEDNPCALPSRVKRMARIEFGGSDGGQVVVPGIRAQTSCTIVRFTPRPLQLPSAPGILDGLGVRLR
jgi:hypothetical protein